MSKVDFQKAAGSPYNETSCTLPRFQVLTPVLTVGQVSRSKYCTTFIFFPQRDLQLIIWKGKYLNILGSWHFWNLGKHNHHLLGRAGTCWFQIINKKMIILDSLPVWYQISIRIINQWMSSFWHNQYPHHLCTLICLWNLFNDCDKWIWHTNIYTEKKFLCIILAEWEVLGQIYFWYPFIKYCEIFLLKDRLDENILFPFCP